MRGVSKLSVKSQRVNTILGSAVRAVSVAVVQLCLVLQSSHRLYSCVPLQLDGQKHGGLDVACP